DAPFGSPLAVSAPGDRVHCLHSSSPKRPAVGCARLGLWRALWSPSVDFSGRASRAGWILPRRIRHLRKIGQIEHLYAVRLPCCSGDGYDAKSVDSAKLPHFRALLPGALKFWPGVEALQPRRRLSTPGGKRRKRLLLQKSSLLEPVRSRLHELSGRVCL